MKEGLYYEELAVGDRFETLGRTITETDLVNFMCISGIYEELYQNVQYALERSVFKGRVVSGPCTFVMSEGLVVQTGMFHHTGMAFLGIDGLTFPNPTFVNDTIHVEVVVKEKRESRSKPDRGVVTFEHFVRKQTGEVVMRALKTRMVRRKNLEVVSQLAETQ